MTPNRYRECLELLGVSASDIARILKCSDRMTYRWAERHRPGELIPRIN
jgi:hypothetical protein